MTQRQIWLEQFDPPVFDQIATEKINFKHSISANYRGEGCKMAMNRWTQSADARSTPPLSWIQLVFLVLLVANVADSRLIAGNIEKCKKEGESKQIPLITDNPCFSCVCKNGSVQCFQKTCSTTPRCTYFINIKTQCCKECHGCVLNRAKYRSGDIWEDNSTKLKRERRFHICQDGIITRSLIQCHVPCKSPISPSDGSTTCPLCEGCIANHTPKEKRGRCIVCWCKKGLTECRKKVCPVPVCEKQQQRLDEDGCCMRCTAQQLVHPLSQGRCWFRGGHLDDYETVRIDECTQCTCQNGTILCDREVCQNDPECSEQQWMVDECCPRCPANSAKNCSVAGESNLSQFKPTQMWRSPQDPCLICSCNNGTVSCDRLRCQTTAITCGKGKILDKLPGSCCPQCVTEPGVCTVYGDPHYRTFDGRPFSFQGDCKYVLTKDCAGRNFSVIVENKRKQPTRVSWTNSVHLRLIDAARHEKRTISLHQGHVVKINEAKISLPFIDHQLLIWKENQLVKVRSNSEVGLDWDGESFLEVFVSPQFQGILCGLCGNFNGFPRDDIIGSDGLFKLKIADFAKSWKIGSSKQCTKHSIDLRIRQSTSRRVSLETSKKNFCRIFNSKKFEKCRRKIHPKRYLESCRADAKACPEGGKCSCKAIKAYISACQREGVEIMWSKQINCKETCSYGKIYSFCGDSCKQSCKSIRFGKQTTKRCRRQCVAGCFCPAGYVIRGRRCVKKSSCFYGKGLNFRSNSRNVIPFHAFLKAAGSDD